MVNQGNFKLRYQRAGGRWSQIPIPEGNLNIGRKSECDLQLKDRTVSRYHAEIRRRGADLWIADLGSTHGTRLDGRKLGGTPQKLSPGQTITIGDFALQVDYTESRMPAVGRAPGHIFISYSRRDQDLVYPLAEKLEADGFNVWIDRLDIPAGKPWRAEIVQGIAESDAFVLLLSPSSTASENVLAELNIAIGEGVQIIPVGLRSGKIPRQFKYQLSGLNRVDLFENPQLGYTQLAKSLRDHQEVLKQRALSPKPATKELEIVLHKLDLPAFTSQKEQRLLNFLGQRTGLSSSRFAVAGLVAGSVRATVRMPAEAAYELVAQALNKDAALLAEGISALRLAGHPNFIPIGGPPPPAAPPPDGPKPPPSGGSGLWASLGGLKWVILLVGVVGAFIAYNELKPKPLPPLPVFTDTLTPSLTSTVTPSETLTPSVTPSPPTLTHTPSNTPSPSPTLNLTPTPTGTRVPTHTPSPTLTHTLTWTPTHTLTHTPTWTPIRTLTPTITLTETPWDTTPPVIQDITIYQQLPCDDYLVDVQLDVWDEDSVYQVYYSIGEFGDWKPAERIDDFTYLFSIYAPNESGSDLFYLSAADYSGNTFSQNQDRPYKLYSGYVVETDDDVYPEPIECYSILAQAGKQFRGSPSATQELSSRSQHTTCLNSLAEREYIYDAYTYLQRSGQSPECRFYDQIPGTRPNQDAVIGYIIRSP